jgi:hypothetical protein
MEMSRKKPTVFITPEVLASINTIIKTNGPLHEKYKILRDVINDGAHLETILNALVSVLNRWHDISGSFDFKVDFTDAKNILKEYAKEKQEINRAFNKLMTLRQLQLSGDTPLDKAIFLRINEKLIKMQDELEKYKPLIDEYIEQFLFEKELEKPFTPFFIESVSRIKENPNLMQRPTRKKSARGKKSSVLTLEQNTHDVWDDCINTIADELQSIGYSKNKTNKLTGRIINLFYPTIFTTFHADIIRLRRH